MDAVIAAAKKANIHNFIASLPLVRIIVVQHCSTEGRTPSSLSRGPGFVSAYCRFEVDLFSPRCPISPSCINEYLAVVDMHEGITFAQ